VFLDPGDTPFAVVEGEAAKVVVVSGNARATARGITPGLKLSAALALEPALLTRAREADRETAVLARLAAWGQQFTPCVVPEAPDLLLLEVRASLNLFGGLEALATRVADGLADLGHAACVAAAPAPRAATWLARAGIAARVEDPAALAGALGGLALSALDWDARLIARLDGIGVRRVRDVMRLPRADFARRYGAAPLRALDQALGRAPDPRQPFEAPARFQAGLDLPCESTALGLVQLGVERLVRELAGVLLARGLGVERFAIGLEHRDPPLSVLEVGLRSASRDGTHLLALARERLAAFPLRAPVRALALEAERLVPLAAQASDLFRTAAADHEVRAVLQERLVARLGEDAVQGLACVADHRPEYAVKRTRADSDADLNHGTAELERLTLVRFPRFPMERPLWLIDPPQALSLREGRPWLRGALRLVSGPERIESGWWDGADSTRDYFVAETRDARRAWVFRTRARPVTWFLQGWFG
jgi:protein ImuB